MSQADPDIAFGPPSGNKSKADPDITFLPSPAFGPDDIGGATLPPSTQEPQEQGGLGILGTAREVGSNIASNVARAAQSSQSAVGAPTKLVVDPSTGQTARVPDPDFTPVQQDPVVSPMEIPKALGRTGNTLAATLTGTLPEVAGQLIGGPRSPDTVPQRDVSGMVDAPFTSPEGTPEDLAAFLDTDGTPIQRAPNPATGQAPFAGQGAAMREAFGLNLPGVQRDPQLEPENTPFLDFSGKTPFVNKLNRLAVEVSDAMGPVAGITGATIAGGPAAGGAAGGLLFGAGKYDEEIEAGKSPEEALDTAVKFGVPASMLFAIPATHSIAKYLPEGLASRALVTLSHSAELGAKGSFGLGAVDAASAIENTPQSTEEWKQAFEDIAEGAVDNRSQFLAFAVLGIPGGLATPIGQRRARKAASEARDEIIDLGDPTVLPPFGGELPGRARGVARQTEVPRPGVDPRPEFRPGPRALTGPEPAPAQPRAQARPAAEPPATRPAEPAPAQPRAQARPAAEPPATRPAEPAPAPTPEPQSRARQLAEGRRAQRQQKDVQFPEPASQPTPRRQVEQQPTEAKGGVRTDIDSNLKYLERQRESVIDLIENMPNGAMFEDSLQEINERIESVRRGDLTIDNEPDIVMLKNIDSVVERLAPESQDMRLLSQGSIRPAIYEILGLPQLVTRDETLGISQTSEQLVDDYRTRLGMIRMDEIGPDLFDPTDKENIRKLSKALFNQEAVRNNLDPDGVLGPNSAWPEARKQAEIKKHEKRAREMLETIHKEISSGIPTEPPAVPTARPQQPVEPRTAPEGTQPTPEPVRAPETPVGEAPAQEAEFVGMQERPRGQDPIALYNIPEEGGGQTTVTAETARARGFTVPEPPVATETPAETPAPSRARDLAQERVQGQQQAPQAPAETQNAVRSAYLEDTGGQFETRVRLADLREKLPGVPREQLDATLLEMQQAGDLVLYPNDDPQDLTQRDRDARLMLGNNPRDLVYMKPSSAPVAPQEARTEAQATQTAPEAQSTTQAPRASVPLKGKVQQEIARMLPPEAARFSEETGMLDFEATFDATSDLQTAINTAIENSDNTKARKGALKRSADSLMTKVFQAQERVEHSTPQGTEAPRRRRGEDPRHPEAGVVNVGVSWDAINKVFKNIPQARFRKGFREEQRNMDVRRLGAIKAMEREVERRASDLARAVRRSLRKQKGPKPTFDEMDQRMNEWRIAEDPVRKAELLSQFPEEIQEPMQALAAKIDEYSNALVREGVATGQTAEVIMSNEGIYLKRSFQKFTEPEKWERNISAVAEERMRKMIRRQHPELAEMPEGEAGVERILNEYRQAYQDQQTGRIVFGGTKVGKKDLNVFKRRGKLPDELLEYWGVERRFIPNVLLTAQKQSRLVANARFQNEILNHGRRNNFIFTPADTADIFAGKAPREKIEAYKRMEAAGELVNMTEQASTRKTGEKQPEGQPWGVLHDVRIDKQTKAALENAMQVQAEIPWLNTLQEFNGLLKLGKTVGSVSTQALNFHSNVGLAMTNGHLLYQPVGRTIRDADGNVVREIPGVKKRIRDALGMSGAELSDRFFKHRREMVNRAIELGVIGDTVGAGELQKTFEDINRGGVISRNINKGLNRLAEAGEKQRIKGAQFGKAQERASQVPKALWDKLGEGRDMAIAVYQVGDDFWKSFAWLTQTEMEMSVNPNLSRAEAEQIAAEYVRNHYHTYSELHEWVQQLRRFPAGGTFVSFAAETPRVAYNTAASTASDLATPGRRAQGMNKMVGQALFFGGTSGLAALSSLIWGMTDDDEEAMLDAVAPWDKDALFMKTTVDRPNGIIRAWNISRSDVYGGIRDPLRAAIRSEDMSEAVAKTLLAFGDQFTQEELGFKALRQFFENRDDFNRTIVNESDTADERAEKWRAHFFKALEPGTLNSLERIREDDKPYVKALAEFTGLRITKINMPESLKFKSLDYRRQYPKQFTDLNRALKTGDKADIRRQWDQLVEWDRSQQAQLYQTVQGMVKFEVKEDIIRQALTDGNMSREMANDMIFGRWRYKMPSAAKKVRAAGVDPRATGEEVEPGVSRAPSEPLFSGPSVNPFTGEVTPSP